MTEADHKQRMFQMHAAELSRNELGLWWLSFSDPERQLGETFLGVLILEAYGFTDAIKRSHDMGLNPGGLVRLFPVPYEDHPEGLRNRLLKKSDLAGFGVSTRDIET